jgi:hypothetical protein
MRDYVSYTENQMCRCRFLYFIYLFIHFVDFLLGTKKLSGRCNEAGHKNKSKRIRAMTQQQKKNATARIRIMSLDGALYRLKYVACTAWNMLDGSRIDLESLGSDHILLRYRGLGQPRKNL